MSGVDIKTVKELPGHKDIRMPLRYAHLAPSHKVKVVNILDNTLKNIAPNDHRSVSTIQKLYNLRLGNEKSTQPYG